MVGRDAQARRQAGVGDLAESDDGPKKSVQAELIEIAEAGVLALVVLATAWSGYQSAKWDGRQALLYERASRLRVEASVAAIEGGQQRTLDVVTFKGWIDARAAHQEKLAAFYVQQFSTAYRVAFEAWLKTKPFITPHAPSNPLSMPEYHNVLFERARGLNKESDAAFTEGTEARVTAEKYVRTTVQLATVLFLITLSLRFKHRRVRGSILLLAAVLVIYALVTIATLPRLKLDTTSPTGMLKSGSPTPKVNQNPTPRGSACLTVPRSIMRTPT